MSEDVLKWAPLVDRALCVHARRYRRADREEIRQECFVRLLEKEALIEGVGKEKGPNAQARYVSETLRNKIMDYGRRLSKQPEMAQLIEIDHHRSVKIDEFYQLLTGLSEEEQEVLTLLYRDNAT